MRRVIMLTALVPLTAAIGTMPLNAAAAADEASGKTPRAGMTYESLKNLPDFSGTWTPMVYPFEGPPAPVDTTVPRELKPEVAARFRERRKEILSGAPIERGYCAPPAFAGRLPMNAGGSLEFLFTPGRVTLAMESGLVRRFYLRDDVPAGSLEESRSGTSIARWEGQTLVVQTTGLSRDAIFMPGIPLGANARVVERIALKDADTLEIQWTLTAPEIFVAPMTNVNRYRRRRDRLYSEFNICVEGDRSYDQSSKRERFDATPPADLPPPPSK